MNTIVFFILNAVIAGTIYADGAGYEHQVHGSFSPRTLIVPLGVITFFCLISTLLLGLSMPKNRKRLFPWHKRLAAITLIMAIIHATMALIFH